MSDDKLWGEFLLVEHLDRQSSLTSGLTFGFPPRAIPTLAELEKSEKERLQRFERFKEERERSAREHERITKAQERSTIAQRKQEERQAIARFKNLLAQLVSDFRAFRPNPHPEPFYPLNLLSVSIQKARLWFDGYRKRVSTRSYLKAVDAYERGNLKHLKDQLLLFPPVTKEDLQLLSCLQDPALPVLRHVKPGAGRRPRGRTNHLYVLIRKYWYQAEQKEVSPRIHYLLNKLQQKRIDTGDIRFGSRWPEYYEAHPRRVWRKKQQAFNSRYAEID